MLSHGAHVSPECEVSPIHWVPTLDYARAPFLAIWEVSRACDLACVHCRASAIPSRDPRELSFPEARDLFRQIREMGTRLLVLTGGDPLKRPDIFALITAARAIGLNPALSPSATPLLTDEALRNARDAGISSISLSLDGSRAASHDAFRGVPGSFDWTLRAANVATDAGLELRINTTVTDLNLIELPTIATLVAESGAAVWSVFFLVPTGRADNALQITPFECEQVLKWLYELSSRVSYRIKTTEAPQYRRVVLEAMAASAGVTPGEMIKRSRSGKGRFMPGMNDGRGFVFISHRGDVCPSGFFPAAAGNVRQSTLAAIYRDSALFRDLRDPNLLKGRCGRCAYRAICGGSRARAFASAGDPLAEDPLCSYSGGSASSTRPPAFEDGGDIGESSPECAARAGGDQ